MLWRGAPTEEPHAVFEKLRVGERVQFVPAFSAATVFQAFRRVFGEHATIDEATGSVVGPGFELTVRDGALHLYITCAWSLATKERAEDLARLKNTAAFLECRWYEPQTGHYDEGFDEESLETLMPPEWEHEDEESLETLVPPPLLVTRPGKLVEHPKFGTGVISAVEGSGDATKLVVRFGDGVERRVLASYCRPPS